MLYKKHLVKIIVISIVLSGSLALIRATYYKPNFFPIGLTGTNFTGAPDWSCPYQSRGDGWTWDQGDRQEKALIEALGVNCIGCEDAWHQILIDFAEVRTDNTYLEEVLTELTDSAGNPTVYLITASYGIDSIVCHGCLRWKDTARTIIGMPWEASAIPCDTLDHPPDTAGDTTHQIYHTSSAANTRASTLFRSWNYDCYSSFRGYGPDEFADSLDSNYPDSGKPYYGDSAWHIMADGAVGKVDSYFTSHSDHDDYIWGWNLLTEDPAMYRGKIGSSYTNPSPEIGVWGAVNRLIEGATGNGGIREIEADHMGNEKRIIIAKGGTWPLHMIEANIFADIPELDAFMIYSPCWSATYNYGDQGAMDHFLYGKDSKSYPQGKTGYHNSAIYFQENAKWDGKIHRRWIASLSLEAMIGKDNTSAAKARRPCPPEIRCAAYLALSRGAKGIMFHPWLINYGGSGANYRSPANIGIPCTYSDSNYYNVGLRDGYGYPFGEGGPDSSTHKLNKTAASPAEFWSGRTDSTYYYLSEYLIDEIKAISGVLMQLEWDSAFSIRSTDPNWEDPCPHLYVDSVTTTDSGYIDLGFFSPYQQMDWGEYLMVVNRDGIADNQPDSITLYLDFPEGDTLYVVEYGDPDTVYYLPKDTTDGYFHLGRWFAPGEGKLFRFYPIETGKEYLMLKLWGECKKTSSTTGLMQGLNEVDTFCAELTWEWAQYKPPDLTAMKLWMKVGDNWECIRDSHPTWKWKYTDSVFIYCDSCCNQFLEVGYHLSGYQITEPEELVGTKSNIEEVCCNMTSGCPELYSLIHYDTTGYLFLGNNTILPHSEHYESPDVDLLKLDMLNTDPDYYYMNILENASTTTFLDQAKLWVVDHDEGTQVATSTDDSIYVYSEMVAPISCKDNQDNDRLDEVLWLDGLSFVGPPNSYVIAEFDDPEWTNIGILAVIDGAEAAKASIIDLQKVGGGGEGWDSIGVTYARLNSSQWLIDVSNVDSLRFRLMCGGSDTTRINRIALVKLESGWTKQEAALDSAVHYAESGYGVYVQPLLVSYDALIDTLFSNHQISLRFDKVDSSATYPLRDYVFQSVGYYSTVITPPSGIEEEPLQFGLRVEQLTPLSRIALINYSVPYLTHVKIGVYDIAGRLVLEVVDEEVKPGRHCFEWKGRDHASRMVASGVYFVKMTTDEYKKTHKMVILE